MDAIALLKSQHDTVEGLFKKLEEAGPRAHKTRRKLVDRVIAELSAHAAIEEQIFYPAVREAVAGAEDDVLESLEEHHIVKWTLSELQDMDPEDERFRAKVTVLIESVRHHVAEEEGDLFPEVGRCLDRDYLEELGQALAEAGKVAPDRPHPRAPDSPPGNLVAGPAASTVDRARRAGERAVKRLRKG